MNKLKSKEFWKSFGWGVLKVLTLIIANTASIVYLVGVNVPFSTIQNGDITFKLSWIDYLRLSDKVEWYHMFCLYLFMVVGVILSLVFIKILYTNYRNKKQFKQQMELEEKKQQTQDKYMKTLLSKIEKIKKE